LMSLLAMGILEFNIGKLYLSVGYVLSRAFTFFQ
jgi:hypothetical protein